MPRRNQGPRLRWLDKRKCFYITWTERGRSRERSTGTADRERAETIFGEWLRVRGRRTGPSDPHEILVTDVLVEYAKERGPKVAAGARIGCAVDRLTSYWEGRTVADVTPITCSAYERHRAPRSAGTVRRELGVLRAAINFGHRIGRLTRPVAVELPPRPEARDRWLTRDEAARLLRASLRSPKVRLHLPLFILIGLYTGRRKQAILSLRWSQVDLEAGRIIFEQPGRRTNKRRGSIRIPPRLLPHLQRAWYRGTEIGFVLHRHGYRIGDIKRGFEAACKRAGLEGVSPHTLRHTAATWLMQQSTDLWEASGFLAMSVETLTRTYAHHHPDHMREAAENIGRRPRNLRVMR
jgi:integrase